VEVIGEAFARRDSIRGMFIAYVAPTLRHFTATFEPA
jgi:tryptophanase